MPMYVARVPDCQDRRWDDPVTLEGQLYLFLEFRGLEQVPPKIEVADQRRAERGQVRRCVRRDQAHPRVAAPRAPDLRVSIEQLGGGRVIEFGHSSAPRSRSRSRSPMR